MKRNIYDSLKPLLCVLINLAMVYVVYFIARVAFLLENCGLYAGNLTTGHLLEMFRGGLVFDTSAILYTNVLWVVMMLFPLPMKESPMYHALCKWVFIVINMLAFAINLVDSVYFQFTTRRTTTTIFQEFENENHLGGIFFTELVSHWYFILLTGLTGLLLWKCYQSTRLNYRQLNKVVYCITTFLSILAFAPFCVAGMRGGWTRETRPISISNANNYVNRPAETGIVLNTPFALIRTIGKNNYVVPAYYTSAEEMEKVFNPIHNPVETDSIRTFKEKNVMVIIMESFGREYIGAYNKHIPDYSGFTPFLDSLISEALTYKYSYSNGRKSIDGMPSILSSIPMFVEPFFVSPYCVNQVSGLAECLKNKGYDTSFFHGAIRGSMGFMPFARATKFENYYGMEDYVADPRTGGDKDYDGCWGIADEPFMQYFCTKVSEMKQPFMTSIFTLSSHHPFKVPEPYKDVFKEEHPDMPIYKVVRYADMALQHFFESAKKQPWFQNTIFVITGDHTNYSAIDEYLTDLGGFCSPVIFYDPSGEIGKGMVDGIAQQIDVMPTILEYLGYDKPYLSFGIDLLNTPAEETWAVNYLNGIYQYVKYGHVLQFNGEKTTAVYSLEDRLMKNNIIGKFPQQAQMERELKAIIQSYMERITTNRLIP